MAAVGGGETQSVLPQPTNESQPSPTPTQPSSSPQEPPPATTATTEPPPQSCGTPAECAAEGAAAAGGAPEATSTEPQQESTGPGTSVASARAIVPGVKETGNSGTVAYGEGSCGPEQGQFWKATLKQGDLVTIIWGGPNGSAMGLDIWPPGTTEVHGSGEGRVTYQSTEGEHTEETFTAPTTGVYPIVIDDSCGHAGVFHFTLTTQPG
jgi:hypothetical protein